LYNPCKLIKEDTLEYGNYKSVITICVFNRNYVLRYYSPATKEAKARKEMIEALKKGDKVITSSGFIVVVHKIEENFLSIKMNDDVIVKITKDSIIKKFEDEA